MVNALVSPPTASMAAEMSSAVRRWVPLNSRCSRKCETPASWPGLVARADADPDAEGDAAHRRHGLGEDPQPVGQHGAAHRAAQRVVCERPGPGARHRRGRHAAGHDGRRDRCRRRRSPPSPPSPPPSPPVAARGPRSPGPVTAVAAPGRPGRADHGRPVAAGRAVALGRRLGALGADLVQVDLAAAVDLGDLAPRPCRPR